jgi:hypothetical protein
MNIATAFAGLNVTELKALLDGGTMTVYSVARPLTADLPVERSGLLLSFTFATPAFSDDSDVLENPNFVANPVPAAFVGTPGFARLFKADGTVVADLSAGPGPREVKFSEVSFSHGAPVLVTTFKADGESNWPERPDYFNSKPLTGYPMPKTL